MVLHVETDHSYEIIEKRLLLKINETINTAWAHFFKKCFKVSIVYEGSERRCKKYVERLRQNEKITKTFLNEKLTSDTVPVTNQSPKTFSTDSGKVSPPLVSKIPVNITDSGNGGSISRKSAPNSLNPYGDFKKGINSASTFNDILRKSSYLLNELSEKSATLTNKISSISTPSKFSKNSSVVNNDINENNDINNEYKVVSYFNCSNFKISHF